MGCDCGHFQRAHEDGDGECLVVGCPCTEYEDEEDVDEEFDEEDEVLEDDA